MWNPRSPWTARWSAAERKRILDELPRVRHGRIACLDLRGFPFRSQIFVELKRVDQSECDMSTGGGVGGAKVRIADCLFRGARVWATIGYDVRRFDFTRAHMKGVNLRGVFRGCDFRDATLVGARCDPRTRFVRCDFRGARMRNADFCDAVLDHCRWQRKTLGDGSYVGTQFIGALPTRAQFGDSIMESDVDEATEREFLAEIAAEKRRKKR